MKNIRREFDPCATGALLRQKRKNRNLSLVRLANSLWAEGYEISVNSLSAWERGEKTPSYDHLFMLADFYECPFHELVACRQRSRSEDDRGQPVPENHIIKRRMYMCCTFAFFHAGSLPAAGIFCLQCGPTHIRKKL